MKQIAVDQQKRNTEGKEKQSDYKRHFEEFVIDIGKDCTCTDE